jgi:electron transfer flavoprotein alpha subunit
MTNLVIAEHNNATIKGATFNTVTAAIACGGDVHVLVAGMDAGPAAAAAAQIAGVAKVIHVDGAHFAHGLAENMAAQILTLASNYSHILFPATASGKNIAPRVAAKLDVGQISDVTKVDSPDTFERPIYAGNAIATVQSTDTTKIITVRTTGFDPASATGGSAAVEVVAAAADSGKSTFVGSEIAKLDRPELTAAKIIVSGGRALGSAEKFAEARCCYGRIARCGRRWLRTQRLASRPNRQNRRTPVVRGLRHQRRDPALGGYERQQSNCGN